MLSFYAFNTETGTLKRKAPDHIDDREPVRFHQIDDGKLVTTSTLPLNSAHELYLATENCPQRSNTFYFHFNNVASIDQADTRRGAGHDDVAWQQGKSFGSTSN